MILLAVTVLGFIPASAGFHLLLAGTIYAIFLVPLLLWGETVAPGSSSPRTTSSSPSSR